LSTLLLNCIHIYISCYFPPSTNLLIWSFPPWNNKSRTHHTHHIWGKWSIIHINYQLWEMTYLLQLEVNFNGEIRNLSKLRPAWNLNLQNVFFFFLKEFHWTPSMLNIKIQESWCKTFTFSWFLCGFLGLSNCWGPSSHQLDWHKSKKDIYIFGKI
jgi:hypothetical protein